MKQTLKEANFKYIKYLGDGEHLIYDDSKLGDKNNSKYEVWFSNKNSASYGLIFKNTHLEFARSVRVCKFCNDPLRTEDDLVCSYHYLEG